MTTLLILFILFGLVGYGLKEYYQLKLGKPVSSPPAVINEIADFLQQYAPSGRFLDMGSGWGTLVLALAKKLPEWDIDGVEASPTPWFISNIRSIGRSFSNYRFFIGRMEEQALQNYDVIYLHQSQRRIFAMLPRLVKALQTDTFILTYPRPIPRLEDPFTIKTANNGTIYLYAGGEALAFLDRVDENEPEAAPPPLEPNQEIPPPPPAEPNEDNAFEQMPTDDVPPSPDDAQSSENNILAPAIEAVIPPADESADQSPSRYETD